MDKERNERSVRAAMGGDRAAFARLYEQYGRAVYLVLVARLPRREDAEDVLQEAFVAAWRALPRLARPDRFLPWLFRIARNKARDHHRRGGHDRLRPVRLHEAPETAAPVPAQAPEAERIRMLVERLKPGTRAIVVLRAVEGWSAEDVARIQGLHVATVRRRYARALKHLRANLQRELRT